MTTDKDGYGYEYDYGNRIAKITKDGNDIAEFAYDCLGRRIGSVRSFRLVRMTPPTGGGAKRLGSDAGRRRVRDPATTAP